MNQKLVAYDKLKRHLSKPRICGKVYTKVVLSKISQIPDDRATLGRGQKLLRRLVNGPGLPNLYPVVILHVRPNIGLHIRRRGNPAMDIYRLIFIDRDRLQRYSIKVRDTWFRCFCKSIFKVRLCLQYSLCIMD